MPVFTLRPWEDSWQGDIELELCGATFCFELKDKGHRVSAFYHEYGDRGSMTLDADLQKADGYRNVIKKMVELDLPPVPLNEGTPFFSTYETAIKLFKEGKHVNLVTKWKHEEIRVRTTVILDDKHVYTLFRAIYGPHSLYYQADTDTKEHDRWLRHFLINAAGLYQLFREYVKGKPANQELQEKT